jgi:hypothetical protein
MDRRQMRRKLADFLSDAKHIAFFLVSVAALGAVIFFHLSVRNEVIQLGYTLSQENSRGRRLVRERAELELERAIMKNPDEVGKQAADRFGMHIPEKEQLVRIRKAKGKHK